MGPEYSLDMIKSAKKLAPIFYDMKWTFLIATNDFKFITSDNPVFYNNPSHDPNSLFGGGLLSKDVEVSFPISREIALLGTWGKYNEGYVYTKNNFVKAYNRRTVTAALKYVFSSNKSEGMNRLVQKCKDSAPILKVY